MKRVRIEDMKAVEADSAVPEEVALLAFRKATSHDYVRDIHLMLSWTGMEGAVLSAENIEKITERLFLGWMWRLALEYSGSRLEKFRAAIAHFQKDRLGKDLRWSQDERFRRKFAGILAQCEAGLSRGAATYNKMTAVMRQAMSMGRMYALGVWLAYECLLRHTELCALQVEDVKVQGRDVEICIVGGKSHEGIGHIRPEVFYLKGEKVGRMLQVWLVGKGPKDLVFPGWDKEAINAVIKQVATVEAWSTKVSWSFHSLRHGKATDLRNMGRSVAEVMRAGRWASASVAKHYSKKNGGD